MRYLGSLLAMATLVALAYAGSIDNSATRPYVDAGDAAGRAYTDNAVATAGGPTSGITAATCSNIVGSIVPTSSVAYATSATTATNAEGIVSTNIWTLTSTGLTVWDDTIGDYLLLMDFPAPRTALSDPSQAIRIFDLNGRATVDAGEKKLRGANNGVRINWEQYTMYGSWTNSTLFTLSNLVVNTAQTNTGTLTVLGGGNVVTSGQSGVTLSGTTSLTNLTVIGAQTNDGVIVCKQGISVPSVDQCIITMFVTNFVTSNKAGLLFIKTTNSYEMLFCNISGANANPFFGVYQTGNSASATNAYRILLKSTNTVDLWQTENLTGWREWQEAGRHQWYSLGTSDKQPGETVQYATTITQLWAYASVPGSCTATVWYTTHETNGVASAILGTNIILTAVPTVTNCFFQIPARGMLYYSYDAGYLTATNGAIKARGRVQR